MLYALCDEDDIALEDAMCLGSEADDFDDEVVDFEDSAADWEDAVDVYDIEYDH